MSLIVCLAAIETANTAINKFSYYSECSFAWACVCVCVVDDAGTTSNNLFCFSFIAFWTLIKILFYLGPSTQLG